MTIDAAEVVRNPEWLPHRYVESADRIRFVRLSRGDRRDAVFLTDEYLPADRRQRELPRAEAMALLGPKRAPLHFILHSAFCCSTLLAQAFDWEGQSTSLKEPVILNDVVGYRRRGARGRDVAERLDGALRLLARPFAGDGAVVVKPSNVFNPLAGVALAMHGDARALLLYAPMRTFVTSVAKKGLDGRLWVRQLFIGYRTDGLFRAFGYDDAALFAQTDLQVAALCWLAQQAGFAELIAAYGDRVASLDSETLLARRGDALTSLVALFGVGASEADARARASGPLFARNAKSGAAFDARDRDAEYAAARQSHGDEIDKVCIWAEAIAAAQGIPLQLPGALLA